MTRRNLFTMGVSALCVAAAGVAIAPKGAAASQDKLAQADINVRELLLLMDADQNGKISKKEWMSFMEAEFNKLDKDGNGELDHVELQQAGVSSKIRVTTLR